MNFLKITFKNDLPGRDNRTISNIKIYDVFKTWFKCAGLEEDLFGFYIPYNEKKSIEIHILRPEAIEKLDYIEKTYFTRGKKKVILGVKTVITKVEKKTIPYIPRLLKGFNNSRVNKYKTLTSIFFKELFTNIPMKDENVIDEEKANELFTKAIKSHIAKVLNIKVEEVYFAWNEFHVSFAKCDMEQKNQLCAYGTFSTNCVPPLFIGDYKSNGCGRLIEVERRQENINPIDEVKTMEEAKKEEVENSKDITVTISGKLSEMISARAAELGFTSEEFIKAQLYKYNLN